VPVTAAYIAGSIARGDFNVWSDIDVVVVARVLPDDGLDRLDLFVDAPARVQVIAYRPDEFDRAERRRDPLATEAVSSGIDLLAGLPEEPPQQA
jgi:predicted nucleotidyltransferase